MHEEALSTDTLRSLKKVGSSGLLPTAYLAGGTALALWLGHRLSIDLDYFDPQDFDEAVLTQNLKQIDGFLEERVGWKTILGTIDGVKFSVFYYPYDLIEEPEVFEGIKVIGTKDIAAMKLQAIGDRGARRDFIDLYYLTKLYPLEAIFDFYEQKFHKLNENRYILLKGLSYFADAEAEPMPQMLENIYWDEVKLFFETEVKRLSKDFLPNN